GHRRRRRGGRAHAGRGRVGRTRARTRTLRDARGGGRPMSRLALVMLLALAATGCKKGAGSEKSSGGGAAAVGDRSRCPRPEEDERTLATSVSDTSGDAKPDVRKVYLVFEE